MAVDRRGIWSIFVVAALLTLALGVGVFQSFEGSASQGTGSLSPAIVTSQLSSASGLVRPVPVVSTHITPATTTENNWVGYLGNTTIYPTVSTLESVSLPPISGTGISLQQPQSACGSSGCGGYNSTWPRNSVAVNTSAGIPAPYYLTTTNGQGGYAFNLWIPVTAEGASQVYSSECVTQNFSCSVNNHMFVFVPYLDLSATYSGLPTGFYTTIADVSQGLNTTTGNDGNSNSGGSASTVADAVAVGLSALALIAPEVGIPLTVAAIAAGVLGLVATDGAAQNSSAGLSDNLGSLSGSGTVNQFVQTQNGNPLNGSGGCSGNLAWNYPEMNPCAPTPSQAAHNLGQNTFGQGVELYTSTGTTQSLSNLQTVLSGVGGGVTSGYLQLSAENYVAVDDIASASNFYSGYFISGAAASADYFFAPATSLSGTVYLSSAASTTPVAGATVDLLQSCANKHGSVNTMFTENTAGSGSLLPVGSWQFFANPACSYTYSATDKTPLGTVNSPTDSLSVLSGSSTTSAGAAYTFAGLDLNNYELQITTSGWTLGQSWSVSVSDSTGSVSGGSASSGSATFYIPNGAYTLAATPPSGYLATLSVTSVTMNGATIAASVTFSKLYSVTFTESGIWSGYPWSVTLGGNTQTSTTTTDVFQEINNAYSYSIGSLSGYTASPSSGTITVSGAAINQAVTFTMGTKYSVKFTESGLPSGDSWTVFLYGVSASSTGTSVSFSAPDGTYTYDVLDVNGGTMYVYYQPSPQTGSLTVNGAGVSKSVSYTLIVVTCGGDHAQCILAPVSPVPASVSERSMSGPVTTERRMIIPLRDPFK